LIDWVLFLSKLMVLMEIPHLLECEHLGKNEGIEIFLFIAMTGLFYWNLVARGQ
jgi:hypothetical protein